VYNIDIPWKSLSPFFRKSWFLLDDEKPDDEKPFLQKLGGS